MITDSLYNISNMFSEGSSVVSVDLAGLDTIDVSDVSGVAPRQLPRCFQAAQAL